jgi:hypothetical protein
MENLKSLTYLVTREPFTDFFIIHLVDPKTGKHYNPHQTQELSLEETVDWFRARGADPILLEKSLDHVWNFYRGAFEISNYREPKVLNPGITPQLE